MLPGRESLVRLVGKRRRTLSPQISQLFLRPQEIDAAKPSSSVDGKEAAAASGSKAGVSGKQKESEVYSSEWVSCPVCGASIRGTDYVVNSHLDSCLVRGNKRKLTQRTLLQLNFCPISRDETCLDVKDNLEVDAKKSELVNEKESCNYPITAALDAKKSELVNEKESCNSPIMAALCSFEHIEQNSCASNSVDHNLSGLRNCSEAPKETKIVEDAFNPQMVHTFLQSMMLPELKECRVKDAKFTTTLDTFIVGRRFHDRVELRQGASIYCLREPQNGKDVHAIKVLSAGSGSEQMLGYLPRELAKSLSSVIDKYHLNCEGFVVSLPKSPLDAVPIQLNCQITEAFGEMECEDRQIFESLWEDVQHITERAKTYPPSMTKYQQNFRLMIEDVMNNHAKLFTDSEKLFLGSFDSLGDDGQRLFIRLYTRKGPWFRVPTISYPEVSDSQKAIDELQSAGYVSLFKTSKDLPKNDMKEVLEVLTVFEMREILKLKLSKKEINCAHRQELVDFLITAYEDGTGLLLPKMVLERTGTCVKISSAADMLLWRVQRLFFLNGEQDLSAFLLVDLGLIKFPEYTCIVTHPIFQCRSDLLEYEEAVEIAQIMDESLDENNVEKVTQCINISDTCMDTYVQRKIHSSVSDSPSMFFSRFSAVWVYSKVLSLGVSIFEREQRYEDAVRLLKGLLSRITCGSRRGYWALRLSVDLEHMGRVNESLLVAEEGVVDPWVRAGSKIALQRRVLRLGKPPRRWKTPSYADSVKRKIKEVSVRGRPLTSETGSKNLFYGYDGELCEVEQLALQYYAGEGGAWQGVHSESGIWMTLFGILMWDVIFSDVPDVFQSRFQVAPLDFRTDDFYVARKSLIESQLQKIHDGMGEEILITSWESHVGVACQGVNWDRHSLSDLRTAVSCIGGRCLASLCRHLALDYRNWSSGMPDLLLWRFLRGDNVRGEAKLVEVKGPRDRLSEQQRAWMLILMDCGFDAEVCKVTPMPES